MNMDREGIFRGFVKSAVIREPKEGSQALAVSLAIDVEAMRDQAAEGGWTDWRPYQCVAFGDFWIIKKDGNTNDMAVEQLTRIGWDGDLTKFDGETWKGTPCQFTTVADTYKDETRYKVQFLNAYDYAGGSPAGLDTARLRQLEQKYGGKLRALCHKVGAAAKQTPAKPPMPTKPKPAAATSSAQTATQIDAWARFNELNDAFGEKKLTGDKLAEDFWKHVSAMFGDIQADQITGGQWAEFVAKVQIPPF
jgi:hypothetical protein